jgi:membrane protease YdiL (CAAX protease family)
MGLPYVSYFRDTRHPWPCFLFLLPLLLAYEGGVLWLGGAKPDILRTGADTWLRWGLQIVGLTSDYWPPALVILIFVVWNWNRGQDRPQDLVGVWLGMAVESVTFALILVSLGRLHIPVVEQLAPILAPATGAETPSRLASAVSFVGAGIYEELLFRLLLFPLLLRIILTIEPPRTLAVGLAMVLSALAFSSAHHLGPYGEPFQGRIFLFRAIAGLYFALLFQLRGFGVAVGTHACYDVIVGVAMN